jgi:hypothetical protein
MTTFQASHLARWQPRVLGFLALILSPAPSCGREGGEAHQGRRSVFPTVNETASQRASTRHDQTSYSKLPVIDEWPPGSHGRRVAAACPEAPLVARSPDLGSTLLRTSALGPCQRGAAGSARPIYKQQPPQQQPPQQQLQPQQHSAAAVQQQ